MSKKLALYRISILFLCHFGIDFICALAIYRNFAERYNAFLLYNFFAFALQMPLGILIDAWTKKSRKTLLPGLVFTLAGILVTIGGSFFSHVIMGVGNALFHVGGGVLTIHEDEDNGFKGKGFGVFVAPGAFGLSLGKALYDSPMFTLIQIIACVLLVVLGLLLFVKFEDRVFEQVGTDLKDKDLNYLIILCFAVVFIRSLTGMGMSFSWNDSKLTSTLLSLSLSCGKSTGGFIAAKFGAKKTTLISLGVAAIAYIFADKMAFALLASMFFNMTMPMTLFMLYSNMTDLPGFAFGILTFALFMGYLPVLYGYVGNMSPFPFGTICCVVSLIMMLLGIFISNKRGINE